MRPVKLELAAPQSRVEHSTNEPLCSQIVNMGFDIILFHEKESVCVFFVCFFFKSN